MNRRDVWRALLAGDRTGPVLVDVGTSTVSSVRAPGTPELAQRVGWVGHRSLQTLALTAADCRALGSDFARVGLVERQPWIDPDDDTFVDALGIRYVWAEGEPGPMLHPLEEADLVQVARHPRPELPRTVQVADLAGDPDPPVVVADAPVSGLLEMCFGLRGNWQFLMDLTGNWRVANALLDWSLETVVAAYEHMLSGLPTPPDVVLYGDDYGYQDSMFLSEHDFRRFVRPRLRTLFARLRRLTPAAICFHCCGAVRPILPDLLDLGPELLNLQYDAKGMLAEEVRAELGDRVVMHGFTDFVALGRALRDRVTGSVAVLATELARTAPAVAAPVDSMGTAEELAAAARAAAFVHALQPDDWAHLREAPADDAGTAARLARAAEKIADAPLPPPAGGAPVLATVAAGDR